MNISSVVVKCAPEFLDTVLADLRASEQCEVHLHDELGRIVITLEGDSTEAETEKLQMIQQIPHILSAEVSMVYSESEFATEEGKFERIDETIVNQLNDDTIDAKHIVYNGHIKDK
jgi:nitrate reductase NapD